MKKFYFLLLLIPFFSFAQGVSSDYENMARARAEAQGVNPDVLEQRLKDKGIDMKLKRLAEALKAATAAPSFRPPR